MKIASIETIQLDEFPSVIWVQVKTDSGHVGLGETFFGQRAVAGCVHEMFAPMLIGKDPLAIERHWPRRVCGRIKKLLGVIGVSSD